MKPPRLKWNNAINPRDVQNPVAARLTGEEPSGPLGSASGPGHVCNARGKP